jgi:phosphoribosyl-dephospho-CoA transferase
MSPEIIPRHHWVRLRPDFVAADLTAPILTDWLAAGRPVIVARSLAGDPQDSLRLGLALPDKRRIGFVAHTDDVVDIIAPPDLDHACAAAPTQWRPRLEQVRGNLTALCRIYGSLAWEIRSGLSYVRPHSSDLDMLIQVDSPAQADAQTEVLAGLDQAEAVPRLDGELIFPDGAATAWREWRGGGDQVMVKAHRRLAVMMRAQTGANP